MTRLHPYTAVRDALAYGFQLGVLGFFIGASAGGAADLPVELVVLLAPLGLLLGAGFGVARYRAFEYELRESTLHIDSGVFARKNREIPLRRIQNVDVHQSFVQRLFGLSVVRFETAGGGETEATLRLVSKGEADRLRTELRRLKRERSAAGERDAEPAEPTAESPARAIDQPADRAEDDRELLFELSLGDLLILSGVTFRWGVAPLLLFAAPLVESLLVDLARTLLQSFAGNGEPSMLDPVTLAVAAAGLVAFVLLSWLLSGAITFVRYFGFQLGRIDDELVYERGLLQRYSGSIPLDKVQSLAIKENALMRRFGYASLTVETAGYSPSGNQSDNQRVPSAIPLADRQAVLELASDLEGIGEIEVVRPPKRARRRYMGRYTIVIGVVTAFLFGLHRFVRPIEVMWALPLLALPIVPIAAHLKWANRGHRLGQDHFMTRTGFFRRTTNVVPYYRVQNVVTERTIFQRRWSLASVVADTASSSSALGSRDATAHDIDADEADELHSELRTLLRRDVARRRDERAQARTRLLRMNAGPEVAPEAEKPARVPPDQPLGTSTDQPAEPSADQPDESPADQPEGSPADQPEGTPATRPKETATNQPDETPANQPDETPTNQPAEPNSVEPAESDPEEPAEESANCSADAPSGEDSEPFDDNADSSDEDTDSADENAESSDEDEDASGETAADGSPDERPDA